MRVEDWRRRVEAVVAGRRWIVAGEQGVPTALVDRFRDLGATSVAAVHLSEERVGEGGWTDASTVDIPTVVLDAPPSSGADIMAAIRRFEAALRRAAELASAEDLAALERWDPGREALAYVGYLALPEVLGRRVAGARPPAQARLEDKVRIVDVFRRAGLPMPRTHVVPAQAEALHEAHFRTAGPFGSVWAADDRRGWHGGAASTRLVPADVTSDRYLEAVEWARADADRVRVMPFLEGVPASVHGVVFDAGIAVFRPVELLTLVDLDRGRFVYASVATTCDPYPDARDEMRAIARRLGADLATVYGYRGAFNIDGILTESGFRPTELNPRSSVGAGIQLSTVGVPVDLLDIGIREGAFDDVGAQEIATFEEAVFEATDATRRVRMLVAGARPPDATDATTIRLDRRGRVDDLGPDPGTTRGRRGIDLAVTVHPAGAGAHLFVSGTVDGAFAGGRPFGPSAAEIVRWADARYGLGLGDLEAAASLRSGGGA